MRLVVSLVLTLVACGSSATEEPDATPADAEADAVTTMDGSSDARIHDARVAMDGSSDASLRDAVTAMDGSADGSPRDGAADVERDDFPPRTIASSYVVALDSEGSRRLAITLRTDPDGSNACVREGVDGCHIETCPPDSESPKPHFGTLTISSTEGTMIAEPSTDGSYPGVTESGNLWNPGDPVRFQAEGAELSGFDETVVGPAPVEPLDDVPGIVPRDEPLTVRFSGGEHGQFMFAIAFSVGTDMVQIRCWAPSDAGELTVSTDVLAHIPSGTSARLVWIGENRFFLDRTEERVRRLIARSSSYSNFDVHFE